MPFSPSFQSQSQVGHQHEQGGGSLRSHGSVAQIGIAPVAARAESASTLPCEAAGKKLVRNSA